MRGVARVLTFAAFVPVAGAVWALAQTPGSAPVSLPDGSLLRLRGVSYGTEHSFGDGSYLQQLLKPVLPESLHGGELARFQTAQPALGCVFSLEPSVPGVVHRARLTAHDEHGCRVGKGEELVLTPPSDAPLPPEGERLPTHPTSAALTAFPKRGQHLFLRLYGASGEEPLADFRAASPEEASYADWTPAGLPAVSRERNVGLTLTSLVAGLTWDQLLADNDSLLRQRAEEFRSVAAWRAKTGEPSVQPEQVDWTVAEFHTTRRGAPSAEWLPRRIDLRDATGNEVTYESPLPASEEGLLRGQRPDGTGFLAFPTPLCPEEPAWKLRAVLGHSGSDNRFSDVDFRWNVRRVPVPARKEIVPLGHHTALQGVRLTLDDLLGEDAYYPDSPEWDVDRPCLRLRAVPESGETLRLTMRATDDRGKTVFCTFRGGPTPDEPDGWWYWQMEIPEGAKSLNFQFGGWRSRGLEFTVRPQRAAELAASRSELARRPTK